MYLVKGDSKFVAFYATQALLWQLIVMVLRFGAMIIWFATIFFVRIFSRAKAASAPQPSLRFFLGILRCVVGYFQYYGTQSFLAIYFGMEPAAESGRPSGFVGGRVRHIVGA
jgi:hypothetical protein